MPRRINTSLIHRLYVIYSDPPQKCDLFEPPQNFEPAPPFEHNILLQVPPAIFPPSASRFIAYQLQHKNKSLLIFFGCPPPRFSEKLDSSTSMVCIQFQIEFCKMHHLRNLEHDRLNY